jgi:hypothetical protein
MKRYTITIFIILQLISAAEVKSQFNNNHWVFGDSTYIDWSNPLSPVVGSAAFNYRNGSASIGDSTGVLLYAGLFNNWAPTDCYIWNKYHQRIGDVTKIYGGLWYHSSMFIPHPGNDSIIILFTIGVTSAERNGFYSNIINYKANNDSGVVLQKNFQWNNFPAFDGLMGIRHGNGRDWWVISQRWYSNSANTNAFYLFKVSPQGISNPVIQYAGSFRKSGGGHLIFNSLGTQFVQVSWKGMIELYNFDRCTGTITSTIPIEQEPVAAPYPHYYGSCAYSPDNSKLYVLEGMQNNNTAYLWQFDLNASNITASKLAIDSFPDPLEGVFQLKLAPDNKIYLAAFDRNFGWPYPDTSTAFTLINNNLSVINNPDSLGAACDFQPFSFNLGQGRSYFGLPNNPDYELGAWVGSPCDTLAVGVQDLEPPQQAFFQVWYNSEWNMIHVNASKLKGNKATLRLVDVEGRLVYEKETGVIAGGYVTAEINMQGIAKGMYIVNLLTEKEYLSGKVMK